MRMHAQVECWTTAEHKSMLYVSIAAIGLYVIGIPVFFAVVRLAHAHMHTHTHARRHACARKHARIHMHTDANTRTNTRTHAHTHTHTNKHEYF